MVHSFKTHFVIRILIFICLVLTLPGGSAFAAPGDTTRVSIASGGIQSNGASFLPSISADGRYVAFSSDASNLISGDTNGEGDVFVRDRQTNSITCVSLDPSGAQGNSFSYLPAISANGRYVVFSSDASNLVSGDTNNTGDIFVRDLEVGTTTRVSLASDGTQGDNFSYNPSISADGHYVAFVSDATTLVSGDTNNTTDVFVHDLETHTTTRISVDSSGTQANNGSNWTSISGDGRYVAFFSSASNLVSSDTNERTDIFVRDLQMNTTTRVSLNSSGEQGNGWSYFPSISADGRYVAFVSWSDNLVSDDTNGVGDIFIRDTQTDMTTRASLSSDGIQGNDASEYSAVSADGHYVVFDSHASNLTSGDTNSSKDIFIRDTQTNTTERVSLASNGTQGNAASYSPAISANGDFVVFESDAGNLVDNDTNGVKDVFVREGPFDPAPTVLSITRADPNPAFTSQNIRFTVSFSEDVTGVDAADFKLVKSGSTAAGITDVSGSGSVYTVTVSTGTTKVNLRLDLIDKDTIRDALDQPLGGTGTGNGNFTAGETYKIVALTTSLFRSNGTNDGWILESGEDTGKGGSLNASGTTFYLGDNAQDRQFRAVLHFQTSTLPDKAVIVSATLKIKKQSVTGADPFTTHQNVLVDIRYGAFSNSNALQTGDFQAAASRNAVGTISSPSSGVWYSSILDSTAFRYINLTGITQFRLAFQIDDNDDQGADTIQFYSGNYSNLAYRPQLQILYYLP